MPAGKSLRTFPAKVNISFVTGVSVYRNLKPTDFTVIADYKEILNHPAEKCHIYLKNVPRGIQLQLTRVDGHAEGVEHKCQEAHQQDETILTGNLITPKVGRVHIIETEYKEQQRCDDGKRNILFNRVGRHSNRCNNC